MKFYFFLIPIFFIMLYFLLKKYTLTTHFAILDKMIAIFCIVYYSIFDVRLGALMAAIVIIYFNSKSHFLSVQKEGMTIDLVYERDYDVQEKMKSAIIPLKIYQTWHDKTLPPKMKECVDTLKAQNPEFEYRLYDDYECRDFIKKNFDKDVLNAFDSLIPGAYKADLWRYCILYKNGGIYLDIKFQCENGFKLIELTDKEYFVLDRPYADRISVPAELKMINNSDYYRSIYNDIDLRLWKNNEIGIYNAVISCKENNPIMLECINQIVDNVKKKFYGYNALYPTGPGMLGEKIFRGDYSNMEQIELFNSLNGNYILNKKKVIMSQYPEYRAEQQVYSKKVYYHNLWTHKKIYANTDSGYKNLLPFSWRLN